MLSIDQDDRATLFQQVEHRSPIHTSHNVTKTVLDWEYTREILRIHLRALSHEGSLSQEQGASHVTIATQPKEALGGHRHV